MVDFIDSLLTSDDWSKLLSTKLELPPAIPDYFKSGDYIKTIEIDEKRTLPYQIKEQTKQIVNTQQQQIELLREQNQKSNQQIVILSEQNEKSSKQIELLEKNNKDNARQIRLLNEQVEQLMLNHNTLSNLYNAKIKELEDAKEDAKKSSRFNRWSLIIAILSLLAAMGAWVFPR